MKNNTDNIRKLKLEIDYLKEYVETDICKKCNEMANHLENCKKLLDEYSKSDMEFKE